MARWTITVSEETQDAVRKHFERHDLPLTELSSFVEAAVLEHLYRLTIHEVRTRHTDDD